MRAVFTSGGSTLKQSFYKVKYYQISLTVNLTQRTILLGQLHAQCLKKISI